ncbi:hypothetical protein C7122_04705 [Lachnospiraceae bacterium oral taxon 096]|nr:hypothetical protein C7122_04705 [Lachnospiraceae bacterium oral taxon 096]
MDKKSLRQAQLAQLLLAKETKKICEKHNLNYFLLAGSALGAVRHKDLFHGMMIWTLVCFERTMTSLWNMQRRSCQRPSLCRLGILMKIMHFHF